jgi:branched-chain amino acid transport system ATP-binding protein
MQVVEDVNITAAAGEMVTVLGRNGAGKTTAMNALAGLRFGRNSGTIQVGAEDISKLGPGAINRAGLSLVPECHRIFQQLTVLENLRMGFFPWRRSGAKNSVQHLDFVYSLFPVLQEFAPRLAGQLSGGQQQMVSIGQALMSKPRVLILDEPSSGLAPGVIDSIYSVLSSLREQDCSLIVVEQNIDRALRSSDRCYVMDAGRVVLEGLSSELATTTQVADAVHGLNA